MLYLQQDSSQPSKSGSTKHSLLASSLGLESVHTSNGAIGCGRVVVRGEGGLRGDSGLDTGGLVDGRSLGDVHVGDIRVGLFSRSWHWGLSSRSRSSGGWSRGSWSSGGRKFRCRAHGGVDGFLAVDGGGEGGSHNLFFNSGSWSHGGCLFGERANGGVNGLDTIDGFGDNSLGVGLDGGGASILRAVGDGDIGGMVFGDGVDGSDGGLSGDHRSQTQGR